MGRLIIDGNKVFEIDEECMRQKEQMMREQQKKQENTLQSQHTSSMKPSNR